MVASGLEVVGDRKTVLFGKLHTCPAAIGAVTTSLLPEKHIGMDMLEHLLVV